MNFKSKINSFNSFDQINSYLSNKYMNRMEQLNGAGILNLTGINHVEYNENSDLNLIKEILIENQETFIIYYVYGVDENFYIFSKVPDSIPNLNINYNFCGHGTSIVLENLPSTIFIYGEND